MVEVEITCLQHSHYLHSLCRLAVEWYRGGIDDLHCQPSQCVEPYHEVALRNQSLDACEQGVHAEQRLCGEIVLLSATLWQPLRNTFNDICQSLYKQRVMVFRCNVDGSEKQRQSFVCRQFFGGWEIAVFLVEFLSQQYGVFRDVACVGVGEHIVNVVQSEHLSVCYISLALQGEEVVDECSYRSL